MLIGIRIKSGILRVMKVSSWDIPQTAEHIVFNKYTKSVMESFNIVVDDGVNLNSDRQEEDNGIDQNNIMQKVVDLGITAISSKNCPDIVNANYNFESSSSNCETEENVRKDNSSRIKKNHPSSVINWTS